MSEQQGDYFTDQLVRMPYYGSPGKTMTTDQLLSTPEQEQAQHVIDAVCQRLALAGVDAFDISIYRVRLEAVLAATALEPDHG